MSRSKYSTHNFTDLDPAIRCIRQRLDAMWSAEHARQMAPVDRESVELDELQAELLAAIESRPCRT